MNHCTQDFAMSPVNAAARQQSGTWRRRFGLAALATSLLTVAASGHAQPAPPIPDKPTKHGLACPIRLVTASWYGPNHDGRPTASGEIFDSTEFTAAHNSLPFGTLLTVFNPVNRKSIIVKINDRGPYAAGRSLDLSEAAARAIGIHAAGVAMVQIAHPACARK